MMDNNGDIENNCKLCVNSKCEEKVIRNEDERLEFALCGEAAMLYVRETSVDCSSPLPQEQEDDLQEITESKTSEENEIHSESFSSRLISEDSSREVSEETLKKRKLKNKSSLIKVNLHKKRWSGDTYFEEELQKIQDRKYIRELTEAKKRRQLWKKFQRELKKDFKRSLIRSSGPEWWQEPSRNQITLLTTLGDVIKADKEEGVTGRTRQWLLDLGVVTRLTPMQVKSCVRRGLLNPVDFLLEVHEVVVTIQQNAKKKKGHLEKPFSVDERLLLSGVCVLQLPTLLTMLHYVMPPPKPVPTSKHIQELLYGDLDDESIRYSTPYMEPLPFRNQKEFRAWAFDRVYRALMPSIIESIPPENMKKKGFVRKMSTAPMTPQVFASIVPDIVDAKLKISNSSPSPSLIWLISKYVSRQPSPSMFPVFDESLASRYETARKSFTRKLSNKIKFSVQSKKLSSIQKRSLTPHEHSVNESGVGFILPSDSYDPNYQQHESFRGKKDFDITNGFHTRTTTTHSDGDYLSNVKQNTYSDPKVQEFEDKELHTRFGDNIVHEISSHKIQNQRESEQSNESLVEQLGLKALWSEIEAMPQVKQLQHAIRILADKGDPLAQLPRIHMMPTVKRWLELREGKRRILSKKDKGELLHLSRGLWNSDVLGNVKEVPKIKCSKRKECLLTWDKKSWLTTNLKKEMESYYSRVRTEKVDNARTFFPTMLNHYDHGSKLNRNFRDVFFTYMPAREADTKVFRPWQS